jgi:hypothetical protein
MSARDACEYLTCVPHMELFCVLSAMQYAMCVDGVWTACLAARAALIAWKQRHQWAANKTVVAMNSQMGGRETFLPMWPALALFQSMCNH